jgi:hypothetical protein
MDRRRTTSPRLSDRQYRQINGLFIIPAHYAGMDTPNTPPLVQSHKPASFLERGVAAPFTTPALAGARIRTANRTGTEFVVPNPSGGRGVYILSWSAVRQLCRPTVHDTLLHQRISRLPVMDPGGIRLTARKLAAEGLAGKDATLAAAASLEADRRELVLTNFLLLVMLLEQVEPAGLRVSAETERTPQLDQRAHRIVTQVGQSIGRKVSQIGDDLEALGMLFVPIGLNAETPPARLPRLTARLDATANSLSTWAGQFPDEGTAALASSLARTASVTANGASLTINAARALTNDMPGLLRVWANTPAEIAKQIGRTEWVLDGWERFCLLWETADHPSVRRATLGELAQLVPMLPNEMTDLGRQRDELEQLEPVLRTARLNAGFRGGGASQGLIARNERIQGLIA